METIRIIIEKSADYYDAYAENCEGIYGAGSTIEEAKRNVLEGLKLLVECRTEDNLPSVLKGEYEVVFEFDRSIK